MKKIQAKDVKPGMYIVNVGKVTSTIIYSNAVAFMLNPYSSKLYNSNSASFRLYETLTVQL